MPDRSDLILRLTHTVAALPPRDPLVLRMCHAVVRIVDARAGSIALAFARAERCVLCATDELAARYEDAQDLVREGPSLDAFRTGAIVASPSQADHRRLWPELSAAVPMPTRAVHAVPMRPNNRVIGVLTVHDTDDLGLRVDETELQFLTDAVGAAILGEFPEHDGESRLWSDRDRVSQATGMVIAQLKVTPADALALLRAHAFAHEMSVVETSRRVVGRELDFSRIDRGEAS